MGYWVYRSSRSWHKSRREIEVDEYIVGREVCRSVGERECPRNVPLQSTLEGGLSRAISARHSAERPHLPL